MGKFCDRLHGVKPIVMMVTVQIAFTGVTIFYKLAVNDGMNLQVLVAYRFMFAVVTVVPLALIIERKNRPKLTWKIAFLAFVCALFGGSMAQNFFAESLALTTATFAVAMTNLIPAATFVLAILFRMEKLGLKTMAGKAKVMGTILCIGGAMLLTFYRGCDVNIWSTHVDLLQISKHSHGHVAATHHNKSTKNVLGLLLALAGCMSSSFSLIVQAKMSEIYPCMYSSTALIAVMGTIQAAVFAVCVEREWSQWKLGWNLKLLTVAYMGIVGSGLMWAFMMCCVRMRGPLFVSVFNPLMLVLVAISGSLFLNEKLHLGSVVGAAIIICGLYCVLWGNNKEMKNLSRLMPSRSFTESNQTAANNTTAESGTAEISMKGNFVHGNNVVANFVPETEVQMTHVVVFDEEEGDLEAANATKQVQPKP